MDALLERKSNWELIKQSKEKIKCSWQYTKKKQANGQLRKKILQVIILKSYAIIFITGLRKLICRSSEQTQGFHTVSDILQNLRFLSPHCSHSSLYINTHQVPWNSKFLFFKTVTCILWAMLKNKMATYLLHMTAQILMNTFDENYWCELSCNPPKFIWQSLNS